MDLKAGQKEWLDREVRMKTDNPEDAKKMKFCFFLMNRFQTDIDLVPRAEEKNLLVVHTGSSALVSGNSRT